MRNSHPSTPRAGRLALLTLLAASLHTHAATYVWDVASPGANNWNVNANWLPNTGNPGAADTAVFGDLGTSPDAVTVNNVVSVNTTVSALNFTNTTTVTSGPWHVTEIPAGVALTLTNLTVGLGASTPGTGLKTLAAVTGGGTLLGYGTLTAGNTASSGGNPGTALDLSGLSTFVWSNGAATLNIGFANRSGVDLKLASSSNHVTAGTINFNTTSSGSTAAGTVTLGTGTNVLNAGAINAALARNSCTIQFADALGGLRIRGSAGDDASRANMTLGNRTGGGGGTSTGQLLLDGHPVDIKLGTLNLGRAENAVAGNTGTGVISFDTGTLDVTTINLASTIVSSVSANGTINVGANGTLIANSVSLATLFTGANAANGVINLNGGTMITSNGISKASTGGTGSITNNGGALVLGSGVIGTPAVPINSISLSDARLTLGTDAGGTNVAVTTLTTGSSTNNRISITSLPLLAGYPTQLPLIAYGSLNNFDFVLGSLPAGSPPYTGYLSNNAANSRIDLVITGGPAVIRTLFWNGNLSGDWDTTTANWRIGATPTAYAAGDFVNFTDSASGTTTVNLTAGFTPNSLTVSNNAKVYAFTGPGSIDGAIALAKAGSGSLTVANAGVNTFSGGVSIQGGTLQIGGSADRLPTNSTVTLANVSGAVFGLNDLNQQIGSLAGGGGSGGHVSLGSGTLTVTGAGATHSGGISGSGQIVKIGAGTQVLAGANTYSGGTVVNEGTLAVANASGSGTGSGPIYVGTNGTFSLGDGGPDGAVSATTITNDGEVRLYRSADFTFGTLLVGSGILVKDNTNTVFLATANSHTNLTIVDQGALRVSHPNALGTTEGWTEIDNTASSRLELAGGITLLEQLNVSQKQNASGNVPCIVNVSGTNTLAGPILAGEGGSFWRFRVDADKLTVSGSFTNVTGSSPAAGRRLVLQGVGLGDWQSEIGDRLDPVSVTAVIKEDDGTWILSGPNRYSGNTTISAGTLLVNGTLGTGTVTVNAGTLGGSGVISGPVVVPALGTLAPGASFGTLTINSNLTLFGTTVMEVSHAACDKIKGVNELALGGTLQVVVQGDLQGGEIFKLFSAATITGDFGYDVPALPGGLGWDTSSVPVDGTLRVTGGTLTSPTLGVTKSGSNLTFSWNDVSFKLQAQTNSAGISNNWHDYPNGDSSPVLVPINPANPSVFFRLISQ